MTQEDIRKTIQDREDAIKRMPHGLEQMKEYIKLGQYSREHNQDEDALSAFSLVFRSIPFDCEDNRKAVLEEAVKGLKSLFYSDSEYVWEMASQMTREYKQWCEEHQ